jgi:hypothetical protein
MIRITVAQEDARTIRYTRKDGKPGTFHVQMAYAHTVDKKGNPPAFPEKIELPLDSDEQGNPLTYAAGEYALHPSSVYVDRNGRLAIGARLAPLPKKQPA